MGCHRLFECFFSVAKKMYREVDVINLHIFCLEIEDSTQSNHASATKGDDRKAGKTYSG